ncbi:hypothetical protein EDB19DRAFT_1911515 [Suillus lakei]|nr:hypothetical protein EDB19DRAFT_1911515 [Suillus lakei]
MSLGSSFISTTNNAFQWLRAWFASWMACSKNPSENRCDGLFSARACYILHGTLVAIHIILLIFRVHHWEHHITLPFTAKNDGFWPVVLSASLQAFYTIYTAILLFLTQRLAISRTLARRRKLTAIHDISGAWAGLGSALSSVWRQTVIPASWWTTLAVTAYLASISALHVTSSTLLQFQTFNTSMVTSVPTTLGWIDDESYNSGANWGFITPSIPVINQLPGLVTAGLSNTTVYDTPKTASIVGNATVNVTTITSRCGLLPNVAYSANTSTVIAPCTVDGTRFSLVLSANIPWSDQIYVLQSHEMQFDGSPPMVGGVVLMVSTLLEIPPSVQKEVAVDMTWRYYLPSGETVPYVIRAYFMECLLLANTTYGVIDIQTKILLSPTPISQPSTQWDMFQWTNQSDIWKEEISFALASSANSGFDFGPSFQPIIPSIAAEYIMSSLGLNLANQYLEFSNSTPPVSNFTLRPDKLELAVAKAAAQLVWIAGQIGTPNGGLQPGNGMAYVSEELIILRLNINLLPLSFAASASVIMLGLALHMTRAFDVSRDSQAATVPNIGVLQLLWLGHRSASINAVLEDVEHPTEDNLRRAGMIDVCLTKTISDEEELGSSTHSLSDEVNHDHDDEI